jgi:hypothetical protein
VFGSSANNKRYLKSVEDCSDEKFNSLYEVGATLPSITVFKNFLSWYYHSSRGQITKNGKPIKRTMENTLKWVLIGLRKLTSSKISQSNKEDLNKYIFSTLKVEDVTKQKSSTNNYIFQRIMVHYYVTG